MVISDTAFLCLTYSRSDKTSNLSHALVTKWLFEAMTTSSPKETPLRRPLYVFAMKSYEFGREGATYRLQGNIPSQQRGAITPTNTLGSCHPPSEQMQDFTVLQWQGSINVRRIWRFLLPGTTTLVNRRNHSMDKNSLATSWYGRAD